MECMNLKSGDTVIINDCTHIHPELLDGVSGRIVGDADDNGGYLVDFWFTRKRIPIDNVKQHLPKEESYIDTHVVAPVAQTLAIDYSRAEVLYTKKLSPAAVIPSYSREGDCGLDLTAISCSIDEFGNYVYTTGLAIKVPNGFVGLLYPRSSLSKYDLALCNSVGCLDNNFRGDVTFKFRATKSSPKIYSVGDRIGQLILAPCPKVLCAEVTDLDETNRGNSGWGSSGA